MNREAADREPEPPKKKKRGRYKQYLFDSSLPIPPSTLHSRAKAQNAAPIVHCQQGDELGSPVRPEVDVDHDEASTDTDEEQQLEAVENPDPENSSSESSHSTPEPTFAEKEKDKARTNTKQTYVQKHHLSRKLHKDFPLNRVDALLMILHLAVRHCNTESFVKDQIKFVNMLFGDDVLDVSYHVFSTLFKPSADICKHYVCVDCEYYLGAEKDFYECECPQCNKFIEMGSSESFNHVVCVDCRVYLGSKEDFPQPIHCPHCTNAVSTKSQDSVVCVDCKLYLGSQKKCFKKFKVAECPKCQKEIDVQSTNSNNYFISLNLRGQLEALLAKPNLKMVSRSNRDSHVISDICDGALYQTFSQPGFPLENDNALTVTFNTDGVAVHKSTSNSLWPIWLYVNEIAPEQRFKQENLILAGLWFHKSAPNMSLFLKPFVEELLDLSVNGVDRIKPDGSSVRCPVFPLTCSVDSVAKAKVLCQKQFNARNGCLYCYHPNDTTFGEDKTQRYYDQSATYDLRTEEEVIKDMYEADTLQCAGELKSNSVRGFLGISILLTFSKLLDVFPCNTFNIVWGTCIDYLHAGLEGVASDLCTLYESILTASQLKILDENVKKITPPQVMTRRPRSFTMRTYWKAKEFRAFILYYALPCLEDLLPQRNFVNLKHYVNVLHILLSDNISQAKLLEAATSLNNFAVGYQRLYGVQNVTYNLHVCTHFIDMVIHQGPLFCYSNFIFESGNGYLVRLIRGTKSVINEIAKKHTTIQTALQFVSENTVSPEALKFCSEVLSCDYTKSQMELDCAFVTGSVSVGEISEQECNLLTGYSVIISDRKVQYYNRIIKEGIIYSCRSYTRSKVHDDSCVMLQDGSYAVIDKFVRSNTIILCLGRPIRIAQGADLLPCIKRCCYNVFGDTYVFPFSQILRKCFLVEVQDKCYVCHIPNFFERD